MCVKPSFSKSTMVRVSIACLGSPNVLAETHFKAVTRAGELSLRRLVKALSIAERFPLLGAERRSGLVKQTPGELRQRQISPLAWHLELSLFAFWFYFRAMPGHGKHPGRASSGFT